MYLISLYFDDTSNHILQRLIDKVAETTGNDFMIEHKVPPHITISAIEAKSVEALIPAFNKMKNQLQAGTINFVSVGQILPYVTYALPVLNDYLQKTSQVVYDAVKAIPETMVSRFYRPGSFVPHVTIGKTLSKEQMLQALMVLQNNFQPFEAKVTEIGLAKVNPHEDVERYFL